MTPLVIDVETTILNKGNPFDHRNKLCYFGGYDGRSSTLLDIHYGAEVEHEGLRQASALVDSADLLIGFNIKFDLHWIKRYGINFKHCRVWDCQLVHFILRNQTTPYPSLNAVSEYYGLGTKLDVVARDYWDKGIDTPDVPREILKPYLEQDLLLTYQIYLKQLEEVNGN